MKRFFNAVLGGFGAMVGIHIFGILVDPEKRASLKKGFRKIRDTIID